jgi:hypothetical protein
MSKKKAIILIYRHKIIDLTYLLALSPVHNQCNLIHIVSPQSSEIYFNVILPYTLHTVSSCYVFRYKCCMYFSFFSHEP